MPDDAAIVAALGVAQRARSTVSSVEPHREIVRRWLDAGVQDRAIHAALKREHAFAGSYSAVIRMLQQLRGEQPPEVTVRLAFAPGEAAQVDFGAGPVLMHPEGKPRRTWASVMTLCHSRHQYVEFVWDQIRTDGPMFVAWPVRHHGPQPSRTPQGATAHTVADRDACIYCRRGLWPQRNPCGTPPCDSGRVGVALASR